MLQTTTAQKITHAASAAVLAAVLAAGVAACGGSSNPTSTGGATATTASGGKTTATTVKAPSGGGSLSSFCSLARKYAASSPSAASDALTPAGLKKEFQEFQSFEGTLLSNTPSSLKPDMSAVLAFDNSFFGELQKVGFNFADIPPSYEATLGTSAQALEPKITAVSNYLSTSCGVTPTTTPTT